MTIRLAKLLECVHQAVVFGGSDILHILATTLDLFIAHLAYARSSPFDWMS